jgi:2-keto-4-pentenoate hydratase
MSPVSGRRLWGTAGGLSYRGVTGQSPVHKKDFKKLFKDFDFDFDFDVPIQ